MKFKQIHPWRVSFKKAAQLQESLRNRLSIRKPEGIIQSVAGADVSYDKHSDYFFAGIVVYKLLNNLEKIEEVTAVGKSHFPYIPGLLSFREAPVLLMACKKLKHDPDVFLFDGQGIAHPRFFGLAAHIGLIIDKPSIGCAKSRLVGEYSEVGNFPGAYSFLFYKGEAVGAVLRTKVNTKPIFISPGHKSDIQFAISITLRTCCGYRLPEPIRQAHQLVNRLRKRTTK